MAVLRAGGCCCPLSQALPRLPEMGAVYREFAGLGDTLFLHVAIVTDTIIKLSLNLAEEMDLSEAIILASALLILPRFPPRGRQQGAEQARMMELPAEGSAGAASC